MKKSTTLACLWIALVSLAVMGCVGTPDEDIASAQEAALTTNALTTNALTTNALTTNALTTNALTTNALTTNALTTNALTTNALTTNALTTNSLLMTALEDPAARDVLQYIVSCALPSDRSISYSVQGTSYTYPGSLGLAPEWGEPNGRCDEACEQWVSGCLIARLDYLGVEREISIRGANPALATSQEEREAFPVYEATYFGNVFASQQVLNLCLLPWQSSDTRVCGPSLADCAVTDTGDCLANCNLPLPDGGFPDCRDKPWWEPGATPYVGSITVFLAPGEP